MLLALAIYLTGQRHLPDGVPRVAKTVRRPPLTHGERKRTALLTLIVASILFALVAYVMILSIGVVWVDQRVSLDTPLGMVPASWFNSVDSFASVVAVPPLVALWAAQARRGREPRDVAKIGIGTLITGLSALLFVAGECLPGADGKVSVLWALSGFFGMGVGFLYYWPVLLALVSQAAPAKINATMVSGVFLASFAGSVIAGWVGSFYDQMSPAMFWTMDAAIGIVGGMLVLAAAPMLTRALEPHE
jgi:POT family proton-dependent oligopeptide transporter